MQVAGLDRSVAAGLSEELVALTQDSPTLLRTRQFANVSLKKEDVLPHS